VARTASKSHPGFSASRLLSAFSTLTYEMAGFTRTIGVSNVRYAPLCGARAVVDGRPLIVWKARAGDDGSLELLEVQPEGKRRMAYDEYLRGLR